LGKREEDIRGVDEDKVEEDLRDVGDKLFATTAEDQGNTHENV